MESNFFDGTVALDAKGYRTLLRRASSEGIAGVRVVVPGAQVRQ